MNSLRRFLALAAALMLGVADSRAADAGPLATYLTSDVAAVGYLDLTKVNAAATVDEVAKLGIANEAELVHARKEASVVQEFYDELTKRGARRAFVLLRMSDLADGGPTWVVEVAEAADAARVVELLRSWFDAVKENPSLSGPAMIIPRELAIEGNAVLGAASAEQMARLKASRTARPGPRVDAAGAIDALLATDGGFVAFGDADSRRVLRETFPQLPAPFMEIDGKLLADGVAWVSITNKLPPGPTVGVTIQASNAEAARTLEEAATKGIALLKGMAIAALARGETEVAGALPVLALLKPEVDGTRLSITLGDDEEEMVAFRAVLGPAVMASRESARRSQRMNSFKQIALGMLNYDAAKGSFPPAASHDADGKPLLSWRVMILPYLDEQALYNQFKLDEPWDSDHNRKLIAKMPAVYADPGEPGLAAAGRTTFVVPAGPGTLFDGRDGTKMRAISDGTSNTILSVEVIPERAAPWTQPSDWEVDFADPLRGVKRSEGENHGGVFTAAFCDGHVTVISSGIDVAALKALLTPAGGEPASQ